MASGRTLFVACAVLVLAALWLPDVSNVLPSSRRSAQQMTAAAVDEDGVELALESVMRRGFREPIALPDNQEPLDASLVGEVWRMANASQTLGKKEVVKEVKVELTPPRAAQPAPPGCSPLCGRHGWGECKRGQCICPVLYNGTGCLKGIDLPKKGALYKMEPKYVGDITLNRRTVEAHKWIVAYLPEKVHDPDKGQRVLGSVSTDLIENLPARDPLSAGKVYNRCAIVGSSGILLHYKQGKEIDEHDLVMRFNSAPREGYDENVGNKTTVRITNAQNWGYFEQYSEMVLVPLRTRSALVALVRVRQRFPRMRLLGLSPDFVRYVATSFDFLPSVGFLGIILALQRCAEVNLYGFHAYHEQNVSYQYYDSCARPVDEERDKREYAVVNKMAKLGLLTIRDPCIQICHDHRLKCTACQERSGFHLPPLPPSPSDCPPCSLTREGCRRNRHWAFRKVRSWPRVKHVNRVGKGGDQGGGDGGKNASNSSTVEDSASGSTGGAGDTTMQSGNDGKVEEKEESQSVEVEAAEAKAAIVEGKDVVEEVHVEEKPVKAVKEGDAAEVESEKKNKRLTWPAEAKEKDASADDEEGVTGGVLEKRKKRLPWLMLGKKKGKADNEEESSNEEEDSAGEQEGVSEADQEADTDADEEDEETSKKVWPEFPGKKRAKESKPQGEAAQTKDDVTEQEVEAMSLMR